MAEEPGVEFHVNADALSALDKLIEQATSLTVKLNSLTASATSAMVPSEALAKVIADNYHIVTQASGYKFGGLVPLAGGGDLAGSPLPGGGGIPQPHIGLPGHTIAEAAKAATPGGGGGAWAHGFGKNAHVRTAGGAKHFHAPIGSLIIAHPHDWSQFAEHGGGHGQHASQQAEHGAALQGHSPASAAVAAGTHKYVQVGDKHFAVQKHADVYVPKDTDIHNPGHVQHATKVIVGQHPETGEPVHSIVGKSTSKPHVYPHTEESHKGLAENWKKLPEGGHQKPVAVGGKHAGWIPHDWEVYKVAGKFPPGTGEGMKWAKDPEGNWHVLQPGQEPHKLQPDLSAMTSDWAGSGKLVKDDVSAPHPPLHATPNAPQEGGSPAKADIGGVHVTHDEIKSAIAHLEAAKSTNVKGPLKSKGHPLAEMDYMAVAKAELAKHPHLKVPPGSKQQHVGQVKLAVLHHLHAKSAELAGSQAEQHAAVTGTAKHAAHAAHAQQLTPSVAEFPAEAAKPQAGVPQGKVELKIVLADGTEHTWAKDKLPANWKSWILQQLPYGTDTTGAHFSHEGPGAPETGTEADEAAVVGELMGKPPEQAVHEPSPEAPPAAPTGVVKAPGEPASWGGVQVTTEQLQQAAQWLDETQTGHGSFKAAMGKAGNPMAGADYMGVAAAWKKANPDKAKGLNTKQLMLAHVNELLATMTKADEETGHNDAAKLHDAIEAHVAEPGPHPDPNAALWNALKTATDTGQPQHVAQAPDGTWVATPQPSEADQFVANPDSTAAEVHAGTDHPLSVQDELAVQEHLEKGKDEAAAGNVASPLSGATEVSAAGLPVYPDYPQHEDIGKAIDAVSPLAVYDLKSKDELDPKIANLLWHAAKQGKDWYVVRKSPTSWYQTSSAGMAGSWGAQGYEFWRVTPNHVVVHTDVNGNEHVWPGATVLAVAHDHLGEPASEPVPEPSPSAPSAQTVDVWVDGEKAADVPGGSKVYVKATVKEPDVPGAGKFVRFPDGSWHLYMRDGNGNLVHTTQPSADMENLLSIGTYLKEVTGPAAEGKVHFEQAGHVHWADSGTSAWKDKSYPDLGTFLWHPDSTWHWWPAGEASPGPSEEHGKTLLQGVSNGDLIPHGSLAEQTAKALGASGKPEPEPAPPAPAPAGPPVPQDKKATVNGHEFTVPADAKVYWVPGQNKKAPSEDKAVVKYVKHADGSWSVLYGSMGKGGEQTWPGINYDSYVASGSFLESGTPLAPKVKEVPLPAPEKAKEPVAAPAQPPAGTQPVKAVYSPNSGLPKVVGEFPPGTIAYKSNETWDESTYGHAPDGSWLTASSAGVTPASAYNVKNLEAKLAAGNLKEIPALTEEQAAEIDAKQAVLTSLKFGSVAPGVSSTWQEAAARWLAHNTGKSAWITKSKAGPGYVAAGYMVSNEVTQEFWRVDRTTLTGEHFVPGTGVASISFEDVKQAVSDYVVPGSVVLGNKLYKTGFYYKPKGKAYLEIAPGTGGAGTYHKASPIWHKTDGTKKSVSFEYAISHLEGGGDVYFEQPKPDVTAVVPGGKPYEAKYAGMADVPGTYSSWDFSTSKPSAIFYQKYPDGSVSVNAHGSISPLKPGTEHDSWVSLHKAGALVDQWHNSLVMPGVQPTHYVFFGQVKTKEQLKALQHDIQTYGVKKVMAHLDWEAALPLVKEFVPAKSGGSVTKQAQYDAFTGLLNELLAVPEQPSATALAGVEPKYLASLPPGIHTAKDVFNWTSNGYAKPFSGVSIGHVHLLSSPELSDKIKAISADFGNGKVVGLHISGLSKAEKQQWLTSWKNGDMASVFYLDSKGGKVSPVHPGAPKNSVTHHVTWSPWNPSEVPASKDVEGNWTPLGSGVQMPAAEVDNYIIKGGLQHSEYLTTAQKREWVVAHRNHDQETVDSFSKLASDRWSSGAQPFSNVPAWTDDIQPAKSYDTHVENNDVAALWPTKAVLDFWDDKQDVLSSAIGNYLTSNGMTSADNLSSYVKKHIIQSWMDAEKAKLEAEQSIPVWSKTPNSHVTAGVHPIHELTKLIPLTGEKSQWLFKPPPKAGEEFIPQQEHVAQKLASAWGFKTPGPTELMDFEGQHGFVQPKLDALGDLSYGTSPSDFYASPSIPWGKFTQREVSDIAREHLLDWAIDNNDARASNFLRMPDGSIIGIDKGRAWFSFGSWDGLSGGKAADSQSAQVSTMLYNAIRNHDISKDVADKAYIDVIQRARKMERLSDDRMRSLLEEAFSKRKTFGKPKTKAALIQASIDRKNQLSQDFQGLWSKVYQDAGWTLPEVPEQKLTLNKQGVQLHSGFSEPDFMDHVAASKSAGVHAFFGGHELDQGGFIVWREFEGQGTGKPVVWGQGNLFAGSTYDAAVQWCKAHAADGYSKSGTVHSDNAVQGEKAFYDDIIGAAKTVSHHAVDKNFNQSKIEAFNATATKLANLLTAAETLINIGKGNETLYGTSPDNVALMAKHYLGYVQKVNDAKDTGGTFMPGDLPRWEAPAAAPKTDALGGIKVELTSPWKPHTFNTVKDGYAKKLGDGNELHTDVNKSATGSSTAVWRITLPTGEQIEFSDGQATGVELPYHGRIRFRASHGDAASLSRVQSALQMMGLGMKDAEDHDMELYYWRHLADLLSDRVDGRSGAYSKVWDKVKEGMQAHGLTFHSGADNLGKNVQAMVAANLSPDAELDIWHRAWGTVTSEQQVKDWVAKGGHLPRFHRQDVTNAANVGGIAYWNRFDMTKELLAKQQLPQHRFYGSPGDGIAVFLAQDGGLFSEEERLRYLGYYYDTSFGNPANKGAKDRIFLRLNMEGSHANVVFSPKILARTSNYGWDSSSDNEWGALWLRKTMSYFNPEQLTGYHKSLNETMVKSALTILDDVELLQAPSDQRDFIIKWLKDNGHDTIRGIPVEDRIVLHIGTSERKRIHDWYKQHPEALDLLEDEILEAAP